MNCKKESKKEFTYRLATSIHLKSFSNVTMWAVGSAACAIVMAEYPMNVPTYFQSSIINQFPQHLKWPQYLCYTDCPHKTHCCHISGLEGLWNWMSGQQKQLSAAPTFTDQIKTLQFKQITSQIQKRKFSVHMDFLSIYIYIYIYIDPFIITKKGSKREWPRQ